MWLVISFAKYSNFPKIREKKCLSVLTRRDEEQTNEEDGAGGHFDDSPEVSARGGSEATSTSISSPTARRISPKPGRLWPSPLDFRIFSAVVN